MSFTERFSEVLELADIAHADSVNPATLNGTFVNMENYHRAWLVVDVGDIVATGTVDVSIQQDDTGSGANAKAITGKAITQLTQAGGDSDDAVCIELRSEELDVAGGFNWIRFVIVVGTAAAEFSALLFLGCPRYAPVPVTGWTEVVD